MFGFSKHNDWWLPRATSGIRAWATLRLIGGVNRFESSSRASVGDKSGIFPIYGYFFRHVGVRSFRGPC